MDYFRLIAFLGAALIGVQVPSFVDVYGLQLQAHLNESNLSLSAFQKDADKYFNGDLQQLVSYYQAKPDPIISDGGETIYLLLERNTQLKTAFREFKKSTFNRYTHALYTPLKDIHKETWSSYDYAIKLNTSGIIWALIAGFSLSLLLEITLKSLGLIGQRLFRTKTHRQQSNTQKRKAYDSFELD